MPGTALAVSVGRGRPPGIDPLHGSGVPGTVVRWRVATMLILERRRSPVRGAMRRSILRRRRRPARRTLRHRRAAAGILVPGTPLVVRIPIGRGVPAGITLPHWSVVIRPLIGPILRPVVIPVVRAVVRIPIESPVAIAHQQVLESAHDDRADHHPHDRHGDDDDRHERRIRSEVGPVLGAVVVGVIRAIVWIPVVIAIVVTNEEVHEPGDDDRAQDDDAQVGDQRPAVGAGEAQRPLDRAAVDAGVLDCLGVAPVVSGDCWLLVMT